MAERFGTVALAATIVLAIAGTTRPASARVQQYQIVRLLLMKSDCRIDRLEDRSAAAGPMHFFATCENATFYPEGITVLCDDRDDDRSCHITTEPVHFDALDLLRR